MAGRKAYKATDESRRFVESMTAYGVTQDEICAVLKISLPTLHKYYRYEIDAAAPKANAKVAEALYNKATKGGDTAAIIFWLKSRAQWRTADSEHTFNVKGNVDHNHRMVPDGRAVIAAIRAEWEERRALADAQGVSEDGSLLPAEVHPGEKGRGAPVAVLADKRGGGKS